MSLEQQLSKLDTQDTILQQYAVLAIFDIISKAPSSSSSSTVALRRCLTLNNQASVQIAVDRLVDLVTKTPNKLQPTEAYDALLASLSANTSAAVPLARGILDLFAHSLRTDLTCSTSTGDNNSKSNTSHILIKALLANPEASSNELISGAAKLLFQALQEGRLHTVKALQPFITFCLLDYSKLSSSHQPTTAFTFHSILTRRACGSTDVRIQAAVLRMLCSHVAWYDVCTKQGRDIAVAAVMDIMDLVESFEDLPDDEADIKLFIQALFQLTTETLHHSNDSISVYLTALNRLAQYWPHLFVPNYVSSITFIATSLVSARGDYSDGIAAFHLLCLVLEYHNNKTITTTVSSAAVQLITPALIQLLALSAVPGGEVKLWARHVLSLVERHTTMTATASPSVDNAAAIIASNCEYMNESQWADWCISTLWNGSEKSCTAVEWLHTLCSRLNTTTTTELTAARDILYALLLNHPEVRVQKAALVTLQQAMKINPSIIALPTLPILVHKIQQLVITCSSTQSDQHHELLVDVLYTLPLVATYQAALPFVVKVLQPLLTSQAPSLLQGLALRLITQMWVDTNRGFNHVEAYILAYVPSRTLPVPMKQKESNVAMMSLKMARAESLRAVCEKDGDKAIPLIIAIQDVLYDDDPAVHAVGLECIALLCESDTLEFYAAWSVVHAQFPSLPSHPTAGAAWLRLLASGCLEPELHPNVAEDILDALWTATEDESAAQIRIQACKSLSAYDFNTLEELNLLPPLSDYALLLQQPPSSPAITHIIEDEERMARQALVQQALTYEYVNRRRLATTTTSTTIATTSTRHAMKQEDKTSTHKLTASLPKALLGGATAASASDVLTRLGDGRMRDIKLALWLWTPPISNTTFSHHTTTQQSRLMVTQLEKASKEYSIVFEAALRAMRPVSAAMPAMLTGEESMTRNPWVAFLKRWIDVEAHKAAALSSTDGYNTNTSIVAVSTVWKTIQQCIADVLHAAQLNTSSNADYIKLYENAVWPVCAIVSAALEPPRHVVQEVLSWLATAAGIRVLFSNNNTSISNETPRAVQIAGIQAIGYTAQSVHHSMGVTTVSELLKQLETIVVAPPGNTTNNISDVQLIAAGAQGLSLACRQLVTDNNSGTVALSQGMQSSVACSVKLLCLLFASSCSAQLECSSSSSPPQLITSLYSALDKELPAVTQYNNKTVFNAPLVSTTNNKNTITSSIWTSIAHVVPTLMQLDCTSTVGAIYRIVHHYMTSTSSNTTTLIPGIVVASMKVVNATVPALYQHKLLTHDDVSAVLEVLTNNVVVDMEGGDTGKERNVVVCDGMVQGMTVAVLSSLFTTAVRQGYYDDSSSQSGNSIATLCTNLITTASSIPHTASAKQGATLALTLLLQPHSQLLTPGTSEFKKVLTSLETLMTVAAKDDVLRVGVPCSQLLASLCSSHINKDDGCGMESAKESGLVLTDIPADGAMKLLVQTLMDGTWPSIDDVDTDDDQTTATNQQQQQSLTAGEVCSILHCLANADRLPGIDWATILRRILKKYSQTTTTSDDTLYEHCIMLAAHHGAKSRVYKLSDFISQDVLSEAIFKSLSGRVQCRVLHLLDPLLAALPGVTAAIEVVQTLCTQYPDLSGLMTGNIEAQQQSSISSQVAWQVAFLTGLCNMCQQSSGNGDAEKRQLVVAVRKALFDRVLPRLPSPQGLSIALAVNTASSIGKKELESSCDGGIEESWLAFLKCLDTLPSEEVARAFVQDDYQLLNTTSPLHASFALLCQVASGTCDVRSLEKPRNMILKGCFHNGKQHLLHVCIWIAHVLKHRQNSQQQQLEMRHWLVNVLQSIPSSPSPDSVLCLATCIAAVASDTLISHYYGFDRQQNEALGLPLVLLPLCLRRLSEQREWQPVMATVLQAVYEGCDAIIQTGSNRGSTQDSSELLLALKVECGKAVRHVVPMDMWWNDVA